MFLQGIPMAGRPARALTGIIAVLLAVLVWPLSARAQDDDEEVDLFNLSERIGSVAIPVEAPLIKAAEVRDIIKAFSLDEDHGELVRSLHEGYVTVFTAAATERRDRMKALMQQMQEGGDFVTFGLEMQEVEKNWMKQRAGIGNDFFENVKATLTPDQLAKWPAFERDRRRRTQLHIGAFFAGEGVDVVRLVADLQLEGPQQAAVAPLLESYAVELDGLLRQRLRAAEEVRNIDYTDPGAMGNPFESFERILNVRRQIRDVNRKHAQVIASSIPGPASEQLTRAFREHSHPRIYAPTEADAFFKTLLALEDLTPGQRGGVEGVAAAYRDRVAAVNHQIMQSMNEHEDSIEKSLKNQDMMVMAMVGAMSAYADEGQQAEQAPFDSKDLLMGEELVARQDDLYKQKRGVVVSAIEQAWAVLTPTQQARLTLPEVPELSDSQKALRQVRRIMRQSMQYAEESVLEAQQEMGETRPRRP